MVSSGVSPDGLPEFEDASETADSTVESAVSSGWELATHVPLPATFVMSTAGSHFNIGWPVQIPLADAFALHASHLAGDQQYPLQAMCQVCCCNAYGCCFAVTGTSDRRSPGGSPAHLAGTVRHLFNE